MYTWCLTNGIIDTLEALEAATAAAVCSSTPPPSLLLRLFGWARPLLPLLSGQYLARNWAAVLGGALPAALRGGSAGEQLCAGSKNVAVLLLLLAVVLLPV